MHSRPASAVTFNVVEATIPEMQAALASGRVTSRDLVAAYLGRIAQYEPTLNATISVNLNAYSEADDLDRERQQGRVRGPLHGIPIAVKDILNTTFMPTTGGALAFAGYAPPYNAVGGYGMNPYDPRADPRTATDLWAASVGTETSGSILSPSNANMLVGIKPTVGLISRYGIIPITADQDTAGTNRCIVPPGRDYARTLPRGTLRGARIGIPRANYYVPTTNPATGATVGGLNAAQTAVMNDAIAVLQREGAVIVDPADAPSIVDGTPSNNFLTFGVCSGLGNARGLDTACSVVLKYGMKRDFNLYLQSLGPSAPVKSLTELRAYNLANRPRNAIKYDQAQLDISDEMDLVADRSRWVADRAKDLFLAATHPTVIVPFGMIPNSPTPAFPDGFGAKDQPYGVSFTGAACSEQRLVELAYGFEQATKRRVPPASAP